MYFCKIIFPNQDSSFPYVPQTYGSKIANIECDRKSCTGPDLATLEAIVSAIASTALLTGTGPRLKLQFAEIRYL